jgi:hypothetical protein
MCNGGRADQVFLFFIFLEFSSFFFVWPGWLDLTKCSLGLAGFHLSWQVSQLLNGRVLLSFFYLRWSTAIHPRTIGLIIHGLYRI